MSKQLVVVVHGVGVRDAGVSTELLTASLQAMPDSPDDIEPLPPHSSDDFHLAEDPRYDRNGKASIFPAHVRRFRQYDDQTHQVRNERVVADFFWGDIAAVTSGALGVVLAFFRIAMGLGHAVRENAREVFPRPDGTDRLMRSLASRAVLTIHGPVIALNLVLLLGLLLGWGSAEFFSVDGTANPRSRLALEVFSLSGLTILGGYLMLRRAHAFLTQHLAAWLVLSGILLAVMYLVSPQPGSMDAQLIKLSCALFEGEAARNCASGFTGLYVHGLRLYAVMVVFWALFVVMAIVVAAGSALRFWQGRRQGVVDLIAPSLGLMTVLWFLLVSAIWSVLGRSGLGVVMTEEIVISSLRGLLPVMIAVGLLAIVAARVLWRKRELASPDYDPKAYLADADGNAERYRLLISPEMLLVLVGFLLAFLWIIVHSTWPGCSTSDGSWPCRVTTSALRDWTGVMLLGLGAVALFLIATLRDPFAAGLGIMTDVLAYLNDYSWDSAGRAHDTTNAASHDPRLTPRSWVDRLFGLRRAGTTSQGPHGYWLRERIQDRMRVLTDSLLRDEKPDHLVIVAHSQGTVIALDVIARHGKRWLAALPQGGEIRLITMGSPARHLYSHYFPSAFPSYPKRTGLRPYGENEEAVLSRWVNIFRVDDFVGTHIAERDESWPHEIPVPANGHTMYWVDRRVSSHLRSELAATLSQSS
jgi:hypothetical protein